MVNSLVMASGSYLPEKILTNKDLEQLVQTNEEWIVSRTGITRRHIAAENEYTSDMATEAAKRAMAASAISKDEVDLIIVATTTPDKTFPSTAVIVQKNLGIIQGAAFDVQAVCSGFIYALSLADSLIKTGKAKIALVIGADKMSSILDWTDRNTCILFGDGAGAVVLKADQTSSKGIIDSKIYSDGRFTDILYVDGGVSSSGTSGKIKMQGKEVFKQASEKMASCVIDLLVKNSLNIGNINYLIPHQANIRIMEMVRKSLNITEDHVISTVDIHANTSAASIPLAYDKASKDGILKSGQTIAMTALGAGLTWGAALVKI